MISEILLWSGSVLIILWGIAHLVPTRSVLQGFGGQSRDNQLIVAMEWIAEGITLCFIGALVIVVATTLGTNHTASRLVLRASAVLLIVLGLVTYFTGGQTSITAMKVCPFVKGTVAVLFIVASAVAGGV